MSDIDHSPERVQEPAAITSDPAGMTSKKGPLVAIVDDDVSVCRALKRLLVTHAIKAETFTSASIFLDVMEALPSFQPECVIVDMHMPGLDGLQLQAGLARIRPDMPVIFLTSTYDAESYKKALAQGAVAFFHKPLHDGLDAFVRALHAILNLEGPDQK